jgi:hypothetical protein
LATLFHALAFSAYIQSRMSISRLRRNTLHTLQSKSVMARFTRAIQELPQWAARLKRAVTDDPRSEMVGLWFDAGWRSDGLDGKPVADERTILVGEGGTFHLPIQPF